MICPNCTTVLPDASQQCSNCGAKLVPTAGGADAAASYSWDEAAAGQTPFQRGYEQGYSWAKGGEQAYQETVQQQAYQQGYQQGYQEAYQQGYQQGSDPYAGYQAPVAPVFPAAKKNHIVAGLLAIFLGPLGIHKFYLGYSTQGLIMLLVSILTFGLGAVVMAIIALIEGVIYLVKTDQEFYYTYELGKKTWF